MNETLEFIDATWSADLARRIDRACDLFEAELRAGRQPVISSYLDGFTDAERGILLKEIQEISRVYADADGCGSTMAASDTNHDQESTRFTVASRSFIHQYELLGKLGQGGMGAVYRARDTQLQRDVALKMITTHLTDDPYHQQRLLNEARAVARINHPNIVQVHEIGVHDDQPFLTLELVDGPTLERHLAGQPKSPRQAAGLIEQLARAAHVAHQAGVVHRDLKPANILLQPDGSSSLGFAPKIADFGLAKFLDLDVHQTHTGAVLGTPSYMAPEQAMGKSGDVTPATDVYALGSILYETLTGRPPFRAATVLETLDQVRSNDPAPPRSLQPGLPRDLETIALKSLAKNPKHRYESANALADDLRCFLEGRPISARPAGPWERAVKWARRHPTTASLLLVSVAALVLFMGLSAQLWVMNARLTDANQSIEQERNISRANEELAGQNAQRAEKNLEQTRRLLMTANLARVDALRLRGELTQALTLLDDPTACPPELRDWSWAYLRRLCDRRERVFERWSHSACSVAVSPDGKWIATGLGRFPQDNQVFSMASLARPRLCSNYLGEVRIFEQATGKEVRTMDLGPGGIVAVAFSPDGRWLACARTSYRIPGTIRHNMGDVTILDTKAWKKHSTLGPFPGPVPCVAFAPDSDLLATGSGDFDTRMTKPGDLRLWRVSTGKCVAELKGHRGCVHALAFAKDGTLGSGGEDGVVRLWDSSRNTKTKELKGHVSCILSLAFSHDGKTLASGSEDIVPVPEAREGKPGELLLWNVESGRRIRQASYLDESVFSLAFDAEDKSLTAGLGNPTSSKGSIHRWDLQTRQVETTTLADGPILSVCFEPGGRLLSGSRGTHPKPGALTWWSKPPRALGLRFGRFQGSEVAVAFHPDATFAATGDGTDKKGSVQLWNTNTAELIKSMTDHKASVSETCYSADGKWIASGDVRGTTIVWNPDTNERTVLAGKAPGRGSRIKRLAFLPGTNHLDVFHEGGKVLRWNIKAKRAIAEWNGFEIRNGISSYTLYGAAFSADGRTLASSATDGELILWEREARKKRWGAYLGEAAYDPIAISTDEKRIALAHGKSIKLFDRRLDIVTGTLDHNGTVAAIAFFDGNHSLAVGDHAGHLTIWDTRDNQVRFRVSYGKPITSVRASPDGKRLAVACRKVGDDGCSLHVLAATMTTSDQ